MWGLVLGSEIFVEAKLITHSSTVVCPQILLIDLIKNRRRLKKPCKSCTVYFLLVLITIGTGLLPLIDNLMHIGGFIMGILAGIGVWWSSFVEIGSWGCCVHSMNIHSPPHSAFTFNEFDKR